MNPQTALSHHFRYLATDKGPQKKQSYEILNTCEIVIRRSVLENGIRFSDISPCHVTRRKLAPCCMSQGGTDLPNTVWSVMHQTWLDYGPTKESMHSANDDVRGVLTDLGTESGVCDYWNILDYYLESVYEPPDSEVNQEVVPSLDPLFPFALKVIGPLHCIDWIIKTALLKLPGFPDYLKHCKHILQYMHSRNHRVFMKRKIEKMDLPADEKASDLRSLDRGCDRFAEWRWTSIRDASKSLARYKDVIHKCCLGENFRHWHVRNAVAVESLKVSVSSPATFDLNSAVDFIVHPLMELHGWIKGCHCHSIEDRSYKGKCSCPFQGMRCIGFVARLDETIRQYENMRNELTVGRFGDISCHDLENVVGFIIAMIVVKLRKWANDIPYLIWQVVFSFTFMGAYDNGTCYGDCVLCFACKCIILLDHEF